MKTFKICNTCFKEKSLAEFSKKTAGGKTWSGDYQPHCKVCDSSRVKENDALKSRAAARVFGGDCGPGSDWRRQSPIFRKVAMAEQLIIDQQEETPMAMTIKICNTCYKEKSPAEFNATRSDCTSCQNEGWKKMRDAKRAKDPMYGRSAAEKARFDVISGTQRADPTPIERKVARAASTPANDNAPLPAEATAQALKYSAFLEDVQRDNPQVEDGGNSQTKDPRGMAYWGSYLSDPEWLVTGKGIRNDRPASYNTASPRRDFHIHGRIIGENRASAEKRLQNLLAGKCDEFGVKPPRKPRSEWFRFNDPQLAAELIRDNAHTFPGFIELLEEDYA